MRLKVNLDYEYYGEAVPGSLRDSEQEMQQRRRRIDLPDGQVIFKCGGKGCSCTVGSKYVLEGRTRFKINLKRPVLVYRKLVRNDAYMQMGGKCQCGLVHKFAFEEVARILGFADCEAALAPVLIREQEVSDVNKVVWFVKSYIYRNDDGYREFIIDPFGFVDRPVYSDDAKTRERESNAPPPTDDDIDPFADKS